MLSDGGHDKITITKVKVCKSQKAKENSIFQTGEIIHIYEQKSSLHINKTPHIQEIK